jgi:hypothetical protein
VGELQPLGVAQRVAVDLIREGDIAVDHERVDIDADVEMGCRLDATTPQGAGE